MNDEEIKGYLIALKNELSFLKLANEYTGDVRFSDFRETMESIIEKRIIKTKQEISKIEKVLSNSNFKHGETQ